MSFLGTLVGSPAKHWAEVQGEMRNFKPGMMLEFGDGGCTKTGFATIRAVYPDINVLEFEDCNLNVAVPAAAVGDWIREREILCTKCRCKKCNP